MQKSYAVTFLGFAGAELGASQPRGASGLQEALPALGARAALIFSARHNSLGRLIRQDPGLLLRLLEEAPE